MKKDGSRAQACYQYKATIIISLVLNESNFKNAVYCRFICQCTSALSLSLLSIRAQLGTKKLVCALFSQHLTMFPSTAKDTSLVVLLSPSRKRVYFQRDCWTSENRHVHNLKERKVRERKTSKTDLKKAPDQYTPVNNTIDIKLR